MSHLCQPETNLGIRETAMYPVFYSLACSITTNPEAGFRIWFQIFVLLKPKSVFKTFESTCQDGFNSESSNIGVMLLGGVHCQNNPYITTCETKMEDSISELWKMWMNFAMDMLLKVFKMLFCLICTFLTPRFSNHYVETGFAESESQTRFSFIVIQQGLIVDRSRLLLFTLL